MRARGAFSLFDPGRGLPFDFGATVSDSSCGSLDEKGANTCAGHNTLVRLNDLVAEAALEDIAKRKSYALTIRPASQIACSD
jgi:hypothetical protein